MNPDVKKLLDSEVLNEENKMYLKEAWDNKLKEAREEITSELREEFANRYEHDKNQIVEATERMIREELNEEVSRLVEQRKSLAEAKRKLDEKNKNFAQTTHKFLQGVLTEEIKEFRKDRKATLENLAKFEKFMMNTLKEEIDEFQIDKKNLTEARVKFERNKKKELREAKDNLNKKMAVAMEKLIRNTLSTELTQLKEDIDYCKKNNFGQRIFEAFAGEYMNSHYSENSEAKKVAKILENERKRLKEAEEKIESQKKVISEARNEAKRARDLKERHEILSTLLSPLGNSQKSTMNSLLESVPTEKLQDTFRKYLPAVLNEGNRNKKEVLSEENKPNRKSTLKEHSGNRQNNNVEEDDTIRDLRRFAGIN